MNTKLFILMTDGSLYELRLNRDLLKFRIDSLNRDLSISRSNLSYLSMKKSHESKRLGDDSSSYFNERVFSYPNYSNFLDWFYIGDLENYNYYENKSIIQTNRGDLVLGDYWTIKLKGSYDKDRNIENLFFDGSWSTELLPSCISKKVKKLLKKRIKNKEKLESPTFSDMYI